MRITFNFGQAMRLDQPDFGVIPKMGRAWFCWFPRVSWNKGIPWKDQCCDVTFLFLSYWAGFIIWKS